MTYTFREAHCRHWERPPSSLSLTQFALHLQPRPKTHAAIAFDPASSNSINKTLSASISTGPAGDKLPSQPSNHVAVLELLAIAVARPVDVTAKSGRVVVQGPTLVEMIAEVREFLRDAIDQAVDFSFIHRATFVPGMRSGESFTFDQARNLVEEDTSKVHAIVNVVILRLEAEFTITQNFELLEHDDAAHVRKIILFHLKSPVSMSQRPVPGD